MGEACSNLPTHLMCQHHTCWAYNACQLLCLFKRCHPTPCTHPLITAWLLPCCTRSCGCCPAAASVVPSCPGAWTRSAPRARVRRQVTRSSSSRCSHQHLPLLKPQTASTLSSIRAKSSSFGCRYRVAGNDIVCRAVVRPQARACFSTERFAPSPPQHHQQIPFPLSTTSTPQGKAAVPAPPGSRKASPFHHYC